MIGLELMLGVPDGFEAHLTLVIDVLKHSGRKVPLCASRRRSQENVSFLPLKKKEFYEEEKNTSVSAINK